MAKLLIGMMIGGTIGALTMALFAVNKSERKERFYDIP